jgi:protein-L-isoaspartate(D-aspartate) O-methyltransferase
MVREQIVARGIVDPSVLDAMATVPRELFVPEALRSQAFEDRPLPLGHGQTISQPYIVAFMAEALELGPWDRVLDVGAGCGYAAAVLARLCAAVHAIELEPGLAAQAEANLRNAGAANVLVRCGDGAQGWPEAAPFDAIHVGCAAAEVPKALTDQLAEGGRLVLPVGEPFGSQWLVRVVKRGGELVREDLLPVAFVPMR